MLKVLDIFSETAPIWTVDGIAGAYGYTRATAYRYVGELCDAGLLTRVAQGAYALGPRIIELDRQIQRSDPLLHVAESVMQGLLHPDRGQVVLLCSLFRDEVLCVHQIGRDKALGLSYARGRPMPLFRGATSKVILSWLPERRLTRLYVDHQDEIRKAGLGRTHDEYLASLKALRREGYALTRGDVDPGVVGIGAPLFNGERAVLGSLSIVFSEERFPERSAGATIAQLMKAAEAIREGLARYAAVTPPRAAAGRPKRSRSPKAKRG
ncbi:MAG TPA: IclR family transcriptional regulator [Ramlibacter sp.]|nr:IclR family transcriptional regulator [Ramlibacter sp.]